MPVLVITCESSPANRRRALIDAGVEVVVAGDELVEANDCLAALDERNLRRVNCEGGPRLFGSLVNADVVDELRLTVAPLLVAGKNDRILYEDQASRPRRLRLHASFSSEGSIFAVYRRQEVN
jgi:5-amino-6-(5-phosphoribosylamino)uracil reductase